MHSTPTIRRLRALAKLALGLAIVAYLFYQAKSGENFERILHDPKNWLAFGGALGCVMVAVLVGFLRWYLLVRAVGLPFTLGDAMRLGSLGFALNFVGPGGVGGDLFKGVALAREHRDRKTEAVTTVIADRVLGLLGLLIVTTLATLLTGVLWDPSAPIAMRTIGRFIISAFLTMGTVMGLLMIPGRISESTARLLGGLPLVGGVVGSMFVSCQVISRRPRFLLPAVALSVVVHLMLVFSFHAVAVGLPLDHPTLGEQLCIVPLAETVGALPLTPGGLGTTEAALDGLYYGLGFKQQQGAIVAFGQRLVMLTVGVVAIAYYLTQRQQVQAALHEAEQKLDHTESPDAA